MKRYLLYRVETELKDYYFFADEYGSQERELFVTLSLLKTQKIAFDFFVYDCVDGDDVDPCTKKIIYEEKYSVQFMENDEKFVSLFFCFAAKRLQELVEQFVKDNPSVKYSDVIDFVSKVRYCNEI